MFQAASQVLDDADHAVEAAIVPIAAAAPLAQPLELGGRYGDKKGVSLPAVAITVLIHAVVLAGLLQMHYHSAEKKAPRLTVVQLSADAPPAPPPPEAKPQEQTNSPILAVEPPVRLPRPAPPIATSPDPAPAPVAVAPPPQVAAPAPAPPAPPAEPVEVKNLGARRIAGRSPRYPVESRRAREEGTVVLSLIIGVDGRVANISIARSSGFSRLDNAARDAVRTWRWAPIVRGGVPVEVRGNMPIPFVIQGAEPA